MSQCFSLTQLSRTPLQFSRRPNQPLTSWLPGPDRHDLDIEAALKGAVPCADDRRDLLEEASLIVARRDLGSFLSLPPDSSVTISIDRLRLVSPIDIRRAEKLSLSPVDLLAASKRIIRFAIV